MVLVRLRAREKAPLLQLGMGRTRQHHATMARGASCSRAAPPLLAQRGEGGGGNLDDAADAEESKRRAGGATSSEP